MEEGGGCKILHHLSKTLRGVDHKNNPNPTNHHKKTAVLGGWGGERAWERHLVCQGILRSTMKIECWPEMEGREDRTEGKIEHKSEQLSEHFQGDLEI